MLVIFASSSGESSVLSVFECGHIRVVELSSCTSRSLPNPFLEVERSEPSHLLLIFECRMSPFGSPIKSRPDLQTGHPNFPLMDVASLIRFHAVLVPMSQGFALPEGGLEGFLRNDLREKVFLVSLAVFEDRWATRSVPSLNANEMKSIRACMNIIVQYIVRAFRRVRSSQRLTFPVYRGPLSPERTSRFVYSVQFPQRGLVDVLPYTGPPSRRWVRR